LANTPQRQARFLALLEVAQRYAVIREQQARQFTLAWPLLPAARSASASTSTQQA
jgi:hypothetical protein